MKENNLKVQTKSEIISNYFKNNIEKIYFVLLCISILLLNIFVGSVHEEPYLWLESLIIFETVSYIILSKILKKEVKIIKGKIDIAVTLMVIVTTITLIFKTYCSLSSTLKAIIEYTSVYSLYILTRNLITNKEQKNKLINAMLISSLIVIFFGIDRSNFNILSKLYKIINPAEIDGYRMTSTFCYSNALFAYIAVLSIIASAKYIESKSKLAHGIYAMYECIAMYALYYSNSRAGMVIYAIVFIVYLAKLKKSENIIQTIFLIITSYTLVILFDKLKAINYNILTITLLILSTLFVEYILGILIKKINIKIKCTLKNIIIIVSTFIIIILIYFFIAKNFSKPQKIMMPNNYVSIYTLKPDQKYNIELDYTYKGKKDTIVEVVEINNKRNEKVLYTTKLSENDNTGKIAVEVNTTDIDYLNFWFYDFDDSEIIVKNVYINGKEEIVNYKYIPNDIMRLIKTFNFNNISIAERLSMYRSAIKLFEEHKIIGNGAKTFENMYQKVREYAYESQEVHSYYFDILMDYGIIGIITVIAVIIITITNYKNKKDKSTMNLSIFVGWLFTILHITFDFDLAYLLTLSVFYIMIALINEEDTSIKLKIKNKNFENTIEIVIVALISLVMIFAIYNIKGQILYNNGNYQKVLTNNYYIYPKRKVYENLVRDRKIKLTDKSKILIRYLSNEKNINQSNHIGLLNNISIQLINDGYEEEGIKGIEKIVDMIEKEEIISKYDIENKEEYNKIIEYLKQSIEECLKNTNNSKLEKLNEEIQKM